MKSVAALAGIAAFALGLAAAGAKTVNAPQGDNDRIAATTAGPDKGLTAAGTAAARNATVQPSKKELKKSKIRQKPPLNDPN